MIFVLYVLIIHVVNDTISDKIHFLKKHPNITLHIYTEVIKCFICFEMNAKVTEKYIKEKKGQIISARVIGNIFKTIREVLHKCLFILYQHDLMLEENMHLKCSINEILFTRIKKWYRSMGFGCN